MQTFSEYFVQLRNEYQARRGEVNNEALAKALGVSTGTISNLSNGKYASVKVDTVRNIAMFFGDSTERKTQIFEDLMRISGYPIRESGRVVRILEIIRREYPEIVERAEAELDAQGGKAT